MFLVQPSLLSVREQATVILMPLDPAFLLVWLTPNCTVDASFLLFLFVVLRLVDLDFWVKTL
jgi:hypothetical protein